MFGLSLPPVVCRRAQVLFMLFVFVLCNLCCQFLWISFFWLPLLYSLTFIKNMYSIHLFVFLFICIDNIILFEVKLFSFFQPSQIFFFILKRTSNYLIIEKQHSFTYYKIQGRTIFTEKQHPFHLLQDTGIQNITEKQHSFHLLQDTGTQNITEKQHSFHLLQDTGTQNICEISLKNKQ